jgi:hypothetical protein
VDFLKDTNHSDGIHGGNERDKQENVRKGDGRVYEQAFEELQGCALNGGNGPIFKRKMDFLMKHFYLYSIG